MFDDSAQASILRKYRKLQTILNNPVFMNEDLP